MSQDTLQSLFVLGCSHHRTPLEIRECFALGISEVNALQDRLQDTEGLRECLVLDTCNRLEIYGIANSPVVIQKIRGLLCSRYKINPKVFKKHAFQYHSLDVLEHALEVATGLDSQMIGETEILGQMKNAYARAKEAKYTGSVLNRLLEKSFQAAKAVRTQTGITKGRVSIGNIAVHLASRIFGQLQNSRVLLLGSGNVGELIVQALRNCGCTNISVSSRTFESARRMAHAIGGDTIEFESFVDQLHRFDILISATSAPSSILTQKMIQTALQPRLDRPLFLIDLAMPRDIDPAVNTLENVYLYNLDDLSNIVKETLEQRKGEIGKAKKILKTQAWILWLQLRNRTN